MTSAYSQRFQQIQTFLNDGLKIVDTFTEEAAKASSMNEHYAFTSNKQESIRELTHRVRELEECATKVRKEEAKERQEEEDLGASIERLRTKEQGLQEKVIRRKQGNETVRRENEKLRRELAKQEASKKKSLGTFSSPLEAFSSHLGMDIKRLGEKRLQISFTMIDPQNESREFYFRFHLSKEQLYQIEDCNPPLPTTEVVALVKELNTNGNFSLFVRSMRRLFKTQHLQQTKDLNGSK